MKKYLESIRQKPEHHRKRIAWGVSGVFTLLIAAVWVTSFSYFHGNPMTGQVAKIEKENAPINVIKRGAASVYESITGARVEFEKENTASTTGGTLEYVPE